MPAQKKNTLAAETERSNLSNNQSASSDWTTILPHRGAIGSPFWSRQHHGVHSYPVQPISHPGGVLIQPVRDARPAALAIGIIANGCADANGPTSWLWSRRPRQATAASITAVPHSLASAISPTFAGLLLTTAFPGLPLIVAGSLKILYDFALLYSFHHLKPPEEMVGSAAAK
jgi:hypothetical protein